MKNKPKSNLSGIQGQKPEGAKDPSGNDKPKVVFSIAIEALDNDTSRHHIKMNPVLLEPVRDLLFRHMMLIEEQITMFKMSQQQQVKIVGPGQIPPGMKLHS